MNRISSKLVWVIGGAIMSTSMGCARGGFSSALDAATDQKSYSAMGPSQEWNYSEPASGASTTPAVTVASFCSPLNFKGVSWDSALSLWSRRSLSIGLSLSGSFEGNAGWQNLTNNFDGMGLSAGILNQTLGTGSLQPLLAQTRTSSLATFKNSFSSSHYTSVINMVKAWESATGFEPEDISLSSVGQSSSAKIHSPKRMSFSADVTSSPLDVDYAPSLLIQTTSASSAANASVSWAVNNLYTSGGSFYSSWKNEWSNFLGTPAYISMQIRATEAIHDKALSYVERTGISDLRTYLLMFDIIVQNGGLTDSEFIAWAAKVKSAKLTTTASKLKALVDIRLQRVTDIYQDDVRSRKYAIIDGTGVVHGSNRKLTTEYCYISTQQIE